MKTFSAVCSIGREYRHKPTATLRVKAVKVIVGNCIDIEFESAEDMNRFWQLQRESFVKLVTNE